MLPVTDMVSKGFPISKATASRVNANADILAIVERVEEGVCDINSVTSITMFIGLFMLVSALATNFITIGILSH